MRTPLLITILVILFQVPTNAQSIKNLLPFGSKEKIIRVRELPNIPEFQIKDGTYYDIGSIYTKKQFLWLGYSYGEPEYVGYLDSQQMYVPLSKEQLNIITNSAKVVLPENAEISFFDAYLSRPLIFIIVLLAAYYRKLFYIQRRQLLLSRAQEELPSWPPTMQDFHN